MPEKRYTKVEEEILQILDKMEVENDPPPRPPLRIVRRTEHHRTSRRVRSIASRDWIPLALSGALAFAALMFSNQSHTAALILSIASMLAFFSPLVLRRGGKGSSPPEPYGAKLWRGRDISLEPPRSESVSDRARDWFERHRRGHR